MGRKLNISTMKLAINYRSILGNTFTKEFNFLSYRDVLEEIERAYCQECVAWKIIGFNYITY